MNGQPALAVKNLSVALNGEQILRNLSFSVAKGEALAVIGPNGAGKTVLFRTLLGTLPHEGEVTWAAGTEIGYVPQRFLFDKTIPLTVREFFLLKSRRFWFPAKHFVTHLTHELSLVGLGEDILRKELGELSGGELQRVLISWALLDHPNVLLLDEPTSGVDIGAGESIYSIVQRLQQERGTTVLLISHELSVVYRYVKNVLCLNRSMVCFGPPESVLTPEELLKLYGGGRFHEHDEHVHAHHNGHTRHTHIPQHPDT